VRQPADHDFTKEKDPNGSRKSLKTHSRIDGIVGKNPGKG